MADFEEDAHRSRQARRLAAVSRDSAARSVVEGITRERRGPSEAITRVAPRVAASVPLNETARESSAAATATDDPHHASCPAPELGDETLLAMEEIQGNVIPALARGGASHLEL
jgi:hypothetical protein